MNLRLSIESDGMAAWRKTMFTRFCVINRALETLVSGYDRGSPLLSLTSSLAVPSGRLAPEPPVLDFEDLSFVIPPDCPTSTPLVSRRRASKRGSPGSRGAAALAGVSPSPGKILRRGK
ncbi:hypothetical protein BJV77DRAFT_608785 [Russula vinacea]|nr:hypothetical protein BJV77DRAFT_608785 [Russula vinacea]